MIAAGIDSEVFRREAFRDFDLLYTVAELTAGSRHAARELLPSVMTIAYRRWTQRPTVFRERVWLLKLLSEEIRGTHPTRACEPEPTAAADGTDASRPAFAELAAPLSPPVVRRAIRGLPRGQRQVLALSEIAGLTYHEIGLVLDVPREMARGLLYEARAALKALLFGDS